LWTSIPDSKTICESGTFAGILILGGVGAKGAGQGLRPSKIDSFRRPQVIAYPGSVPSRGMGLLFLERPSVAWVFRKRPAVWLPRGLDACHYLRFARGLALGPRQSAGLPNLPLQTPPPSPYLNRFDAGLPL